MVLSKARPARFDPESAPPGVELKFVSFWQTRPKISPRAQHVHTNGASKEGTIESARNWSESKPNSNTLPHYQFDRTSGRVAKLLPSDRKGIGSSTASDARGLHGNVADWTLVFETADTGYLDDPTISAFTDEQIQNIAVVMAYESITAGGGNSIGIPFTYPEEWHASGSCSHTEPFGYPYTTLYRGKICPGEKKKRQVRDVILPLAAEIADAWLNPSPEEDDMPISDTDAEKIAKAVWSYQLTVDNGSRKMRGAALSVLGWIKNQTNRIAGYR